MSHLLVKPEGSLGKVHDITPQTANWSYVGFGLYRLEEGHSVAEMTEDREVILVVVEGKVRISTEKKDFGVLGDRMNVFERTKPHCVYMPAETAWVAIGQSDCTLAVCSAPATARYPATVIEDIGFEERGSGSNTRYIHPIAMEDKDVASSLFVTEVFTPAGNWSSYPPHRHDEDNFPHMTYLEETYYHRLNPSQGFGFQRVFTEDGSLDETMSVSDGDLVLVPKGQHPCGAPHGYEMYYLNVMAGPLRKWRFQNHPDHAWIVEGK